MKAAHGAVLLGLLVSACGYRFTSGGESLPEGIRSVYAPVFVNETSEPGLEAVFTQRFREQLVRAGVSGDENSDARVEGVIHAVSGGPTNYTPLSRALASYRLTAVAEVKLVKNGLTVTQATVSASEDYLPAPDVLLSEANRQAAVHRLAEALMRQAYERLATGLSK